MTCRTRLITIHTLTLMLGMYAILIYAADDPGQIAVSEPLSYVRLYCDSNGDSHFVDEVMPFTLIDFAPPAPPISVSDTMAADTVAIISSPSGWHGDWHQVTRWR